MTEPGSWQELQAQFYSALADIEREPGPEKWVHVWRVLVSHPWLQEQLASIAARVLQQNWLPAHHREDLIHDALLLLASHLRTAPDLRVDRTLAAEHFAGWMTTILTHNCQQAARPIRKHRGRTLQLPGHDMGPRDSRLQATLVELNQTIDELKEPQRTVLQLYAKGHTLKHIAQTLRISYWNTRQLFKEGVRELQ